jgi:endonuclease/exonuclease/phosphatase family metal-dependent hydrolase
MMTMAGLVIAAQPVLAEGVGFMSLNQYLGADLSPVLAAAGADPFDPVAFNAAIVGALAEAAGNKTAQRLGAQAELILKRGPDLVGLQEVFAFDCADPFATGACDDSLVAGAFNDFLDLTLAALGGEYYEAAQVVNFRVDGVNAIPFFLPGYPQPAFVTVQDRDVILAREGIATTPVNFNCAPVNVSADGCNYIARLPFGGLTVVRGYVGVDATVNGHAVRAVDTHLETKEPPIPPLIQNLQAGELLTVLAATPNDRKLVVLGDINSSPDDPPSSPYGQFSASGYTDAWTLRPGNVEGATCCQRSDLSNQQSSLSARIDVVFSREYPARAVKVRTLGDVVSSKTHPPGLGVWASDHAAVAADLRFE